MKCPSCGYENPDNAPFCGLCQVSFIKPKLEIPEPVRQSAAASAPVRQERELNWFQRHLNITFLLPVILAFFGGMLMAILRIRPDNFMSFLPMGALFLAAIILALGVWVLHEKNRSYFWIILLFIGIGWIIFLVLGNHRDDPYYARPKAPPAGAMQQSKYM